MGKFKLFDYTKDGPGVSKYDKKPSGFVLFWRTYKNKFFRICGMTFIYLLCCVPVITIGPATAGFAYIMRDMAREKPGFLWHDYWNAIKKNWKQSTAMGLIDLVVAAVVYSDIMICNFFAAEFGKVWLTYLQGVIIAIALIYFFVRTYAYTLIVTFDIKLTTVIKNSFYLTMLGIVRCLFTVGAFIGVAAIIVLIFIIFANIVGDLALFITLAAIIFIPVGMMGLAISMNTWPVIEKFMVKPAEKEEMEKEAGDTYNDEATDVIFRDMGRQKKDKK